MYRPAWVTLREVLRAASRGHTFSDLNDQLAVFVPKDTEDAAPCVREACDTRPLSLKNADVKTVTAVANGPLQRALTSWAAEEQRGFIRGRNFRDNVVDPALAYHHGDAIMQDAGMYHPRPLVASPHGGDMAAKIKIGS